MKQLTAVRTVRTTGKSHLGYPKRRSSAGSETACGRYLKSETEMVPWKSTDPSDRCIRCAEIASR